MKKINAWTTGEIAVLRRYTVEAGSFRWGPKRLAGLPALSRHPHKSIVQAIYINGFADPKRSKAVQKGRRLDEDGKAALVEFLNGEGKYWPAPAVAKRFKISETQVLNARREHEPPLKFSHEESMHDRVYRRWWKRRQKNRAAKLVANNEKQRAGVRAELEQKERAATAAGTRTKKRRRCKVCGTIWDRSDQYFHVFNSRLKDGSPSTYLSSICLACPRKASRQVD